MQHSFTQSQQPIRIRLQHLPTMTMRDLRINFYIQPGNFLLSRKTPNQNASVSLQPMKIFNRTLQGHCDTLCLGSRWSWSCYLS